MQKNIKENRRMIKYQIEKHAVAGSTNLLATGGDKGGGHIYSIKADKDMDNGVLVAPDKFVEMEYWTAKNSTGFAGEIIGQAANGNWYVHVSDPGDAFLVLTVPMTYEEWTNDFKDEANFFNGKDDLMRCYELKKHDIFELSADGFVNTPAKDQTVVADATRKLLNA